MKHDPADPTTCLAGLCDCCGASFLIPTKTPLDMIVTCPTCLFVSESVEFLSAWNELREVEAVPNG